MDEAQQGLMKFNLTIEAGADAPDDLIDELRRQVFAELSELGVEAISLSLNEPAPEGAKSAEAFAFGKLAVAVSPAFLPRLVAYLQSWALRGESRKVHVQSLEGDRSVQIESSPTAISTQELNSHLASLTEALAPTPGAS
jgi:hypothetical protein